MFLPLLPNFVLNRYMNLPIFILYRLVCKLNLRQKVLIRKETFDVNEHRIYFEILFRCHDPLLGIGANDSEV